MIAELLGVFERAQIDRHGRAYGQSVHFFADRQQITAQRTGGTGEQHVVDGAAQDLADSFHVFERQGLGPGATLDDAERALERGLRIVGQTQCNRKFSRYFRTFLGDHCGERGIAQQLTALGQRLFPERHSLGDAGARRVQQAIDHATLILFEPRLRQLDALFGFRRRVSQRQHYLDEGESIGITVMDTRGEHAAALIILDEMKLPQRLGVIQRRRSQFADEFFQRKLVGLAGQSGQAHMPIHVEVGVGFPRRGVAGIDRLLAEARIGEEAIGEQALEFLQFQAAVEKHQPGDHHQIRRAFHAQPRRIDPGHGLACCVLCIRHARLPFLTLAV